MDWEEVLDLPCRSGHLAPCWGSALHYHGSWSSRRGRSPLAFDHPLSHMNPTDLSLTFPVLRSKYI